MPLLNFEFKAKATDIISLEKKLLKLDPVFIGEDHQVDTYFNVPQGRLKLREGNIENALIYYERQDTAGAKQSNVLLFMHAPDRSLKEIMIKLHGVKVIVDKKRRIYFIENVKFHFDTLADLGTFVEVEAIDKTGESGIKHLQEQCEQFAALFNIEPADYISFSYSDLLMEQQKQGASIR